MKNLKNRPVFSISHFAFRNTLQRDIDALETNLNEVKNNIFKYDIIKTSELEIKKRIAAKIDNDYHNADKLKDAMKQNNEMVEDLKDNRTE